MNETKCPFGLRPELQALPSKMGHLSVDERGYRVREPEPPRDLLQEALLVIEAGGDDHIWHPSEPLTPVASREHLLALWSLLPSDIKAVLRLRAKGLL